MSIDIAPGTQVTVKIIKRPTSQAAAKTLLRVLRKDPTVRAEDRRLEASRDRHFSTKPRGGRPWNRFVPAKAPVKPEPGVTGTLTATLDVLKDLNSVSRFIEVSKA